MSEKSKFAQKEEEILAFWEQNKIFEKTLTKKSPKGDYVFYDGPPFATGLPHYGHIVASLMKDAIPRFRTMQGYHVERRWGWDCHGLPVENLAEKELNLKTKKEIEARGIDKFNAYCHSIVLRYAKEWQGIVKRLARWVDMERDYKTMEPNYMESIWWVFKSLFDKGLIYEDYRVTPYCPRCGTPLSNFELNQPGAYREVSDQSVYVKFPVKGQGNTYFLVWTTTPWTLPANTALAIGKDIDYVLIKLNPPAGRQNSKLILAKKRLEVIKDEYEIIKTIKGKDLVGLEYEPLYPMKLDKTGYKVVAADFVSTEDGTGIVHIAPAFGEDDMNLGKAENLPTVITVDLEGKVIKNLGIPGEGEFVKIADEDIKTNFKNRDLLFKEEKIVHSYPFCWRCESPLLYYPIHSWYVAVTKIKDKVVANNQKINWVPAHLKEGRFGKWLSEIRDWAISRNRFWGSPIPIWRCQTGKNQKSPPEAGPPLEEKVKSQKSCVNIKVIGSIRELEELSGQKINDLHKHIIDKIIFKCKKCGGEMKRVPEVLDCWFESGSMPYAQFHYPFANKEKFLNNFPAQFIAEGIDQTRGWFYTLLVLSSALFNKPAAKNILVNGIVLSEDGQKMSKSKGNFPDPQLVFDKYGVDALRYYLFSSPVMAAENLNFSEKGVDEALKKVVILLGNVLNFYLLYAPKEKAPTIKDKKSNNILDRWILARLNQLISEETQALESYDLPRACRPLAEFINDLSTWYLRRSRARFKDETTKKEAINTLRYTLNILSKLLTPFLPFMAEEVFQTVTGYNFKACSKSVHLADWPKTEKADQKIIAEMEPAKKIVEQALSARARAGIKIRQPLNFYSTDLVKKLSKEIIEIIKEELNIKELRFGKEELDIKIDDKLKEEGLVRDLTRLINNLRKEAGLTINNRVIIYFESTDELLKKIIANNKKELLENTLSQDFKEEKINEQSFYLLEAKIDGQVIKLGIKRQWD
ncbi:MAG: isoleucine--tRNA ligase [bacterium]